MNIKNLIFIYCLTIFFPVATATATIPEGKIQALFLYKFIQNVNWPNGKTNLTVGFLGESPAQGEFQNMLSSKSNTNITTRKVALSEVAECDVVFLPASQNHSFNSLLEQTKNNSVLIVTEEHGLIKKGAGISFVRDGDNMSFVVNRSSIEERKLKVTSSLLSLGKQM